MTGMRFDFQVAGEFLVAASRDGKYVVQTRQEPWGTSVTVNTAVAANVEGDRVGVYAREASFLMVNDRPVEELDVEKYLPHGGTLQRHGGQVVLLWRDGGQLTVTQVADTLNYAFVPSSTAVPAMAGLLGSSGAAEKVAGRDGSMVVQSDPDFVNKLYKQVANSWRIKQSESLFHYWRGENTAKFTDLNFPPKIVTAASLAPETRSKAEATCRAIGVRTQLGLDNCVLDVGLTGKPAYAVASVGAGAVPPRFSAPASGGGSASASLESSPASATKDQYAIKIGDTVSPDHPSAGAGVIKNPGEKQSYLFSAHAGTVIYVSVGPCETDSPSTFEVYQPDKKVIGGEIGCADFGPINLGIDGTYGIVVSVNKPPMKYSFTLRTTTSDQYPIKIGDTVSPDRPAPGAGTITQLGQKQSYSFAGKTGETIYIKLGPCEGAKPSFAFLKPDNSWLDLAIADCQSSFRETLPVSGTYHIVASTDKANVASRYSFFVRTVPPDQHFSVRLPTTISPGVPAKDTGRTSAPGADQLYDFTARPGTVVRIEGKCGTPCPNLTIRATRVGDVSDRNFWDLNALKNDWKLPEGGRYTIQVRSKGYVGEYGFTASEVVQPR